MNLLVSDICGTIVYENTTRGFLLWLATRGFRKTEISAALSRPVSWLDGRSGLDISRRWLVRSLRGSTYRWLEDEAAAYVDAAIAWRGRGSLLEEMSRFRDGGGEIVLASATLDPIAGAFARHVQARTWMSSRLDVDDAGRCRSRLAEDLTGRKWELVEPLVRSLAPSRLIVHTDNHSDLDLMRRADEIVFYGQPTEAMVRELGPEKLVVRSAEGS